MPDASCWRSPATATSTASCARARDRPGVAERVRFLGNLPQDDVGELLAAADVVVVPSVRDDSGNVDGLPNVVLEALASARRSSPRRPAASARSSSDGRDRPARRRSAMRRRWPPRSAAARATRRGAGESAAPARAVVEQRFGWERGGGSGSRPPTTGRLPSSHCAAKIYRLIRCQQLATPEPGLSVFFPAYNDSGTIASLVITALQTARTLTPDFEVIVVNDGSADATARDRRRARAHLSRGPGRAPPSATAATAARCAAASRRPRGSWSSTPTATRSTIRRRWRCSGARFDDDVDLVNGYKISRSDPLHRIVIGRIYHHTVKLLFGLRVRDVDCDFRLLRRSIFDTRARSRRTAASSAWR